MQTRAKLVEPIKAAWMAGFFDGESYIGVIRAKYAKWGTYYRVQISIGQAARKPIDLIQEAFGFGRVYLHKTGHKDFWYWRVTGEKAYEVVRTLLPYLIVKKSQAELVLQFGAISMGRDRYGYPNRIPLDVQQHRAAIWAALVELNGGRALQAERLSEKAPLGTAGDAIVRPHGNINHESHQEIDDRLVN